MDINIRKLIKIGTRENIEKLLYYGEVYMNHYNYFRNKEVRDYLRGDFAECLAYSPIENIRFPLWEKSGIEIINAKINENVDVSHLYSMVMIDDSFWSMERKIDRRIEGFGDTALIIKPKEFIERVIVNYRSKIKFGSVDYYEVPLVPKKINEFSKRMGYNYQNEFRIVVKSTTEDPLNFTIGSLENIAIIVPTEDLFRLKFKFQ